MKARAITLVAVLAGCSELAPLPCTDDATCGAGGACIDGFCAQSDSECASGFRYHDSAGSLAGTCTNTGNGGSGDGGTSAGPDPIYSLTAGGTGMTVDTTAATHELSPSCAGIAGIDVMFNLDVPSIPTRLYVDTYGTSFDVVLAIYKGRCESLLVSGTGTEVACVNAPSCGPTSKQWSANVSGGSHCIVIDQPTRSDVHASVTVRAMIGPPAQDAFLSGTNNSTTCGPDEWTPDPYKCALPDGPDAVWFFMACSGQYLATAVPTNWIGELESGTMDQPSIECSAGDYGVVYNSTRPAPLWIFANAGAAPCGQVGLYID